MTDDRKMNSFLSKRNSNRVLHWSILSTCDFGHRLYVINSQHWKQSPYFKSQAFKYHCDEKLKILTVSEGTSHRFKRVMPEHIFFFLICSFYKAFMDILIFVLIFIYESLLQYINRVYCSFLFSCSAVFIPE